MEAVNRVLAFLFCRFFFLAEAFFDGAVAFLIIKLAEIIGFALAQTGTLPGGGILFHVRLVCCFTTVVIGKGTVKPGEKLGKRRQKKSSTWWMIS